MSRVAGFVAASALVCLTAMVLTFIPFREAPRVGQMLFLPGEPSSPVVNADLAGLVVSQCLPSPSGTRIEGRLDQPPGSVYVLVSGGDVAQAGVRVGRADLQDRFSNDSLQGMFQITVPWADRRSQFAVSPWQFERPVELQHGPVVGCP